MSRPGLPGGKSLSLACPRESDQREGHPTAPVLRTALDVPIKPGGCGTRAARSDSPRRLPPIFPAIRGGAEGDKTGVGRNRYCAECRLRCNALRLLAPYITPLRELALQGQLRENNKGQTTVF